MVDFLSQQPVHERTSRISDIITPPAPAAADANLAHPDVPVGGGEEVMAETDPAAIEIGDEEAPADTLPEPFREPVTVGLLGGRPALLPLRAERSLSAQFDADLSAYLSLRGVAFHRTVSANQQTFYYVDAMSALFVVGLMQAYDRFPVVYTINPIERTKALKRAKMPAAKAFKVSTTAYVNFRVYVAEEGKEGVVEGQPIAVILCDRELDGRWMPRGSHGPLRKLMPPSKAGARLGFEHADYLGRYSHAFTPEGTESRILDVARIEAPQPGHIDVVYTWVDGEDPLWQARKAAFTGGDAPVLKSSDNLLRYLSRDELRFSLRSINDYAPWVRNIYLVTDDQRPEWLVDHPRLKVISHREIFKDPSVLPVFNSHAIESQLHHIEGLSEYFIYMNDDVFFGRPNPIDVYFERNGIAKLLVSPASFVDPTLDLPDMIPTDLAALNMQRLMLRDFGVVPLRKTLHAPHPLRRSILAEMEERYAEEWAITAAAKVRSATDIATVSMFYHHYAWATGRSVVRAPGSEAYKYVDVGKLGMDLLLEEVLKKTPHYFCINATQFEETDMETQNQVLKRFFERMFPVPSPFERR